MWTFLSNGSYPFNWYLALSFQQSSNVRRCISRFSQGFWHDSSRYFTEKKLSTYNLSIASIAFLRSYLQDRLQCVLVNGTYSQETSITSGVLQGSILGPLLFCIFINDLPLCLTRASVLCDLFADDGTLNTANDNIDNIRRDLQQSLYEVSRWCCRNRMALNPAKTKCMLMATRQKHQKKRRRKKAPFKSKVRDHANRASFKTSPTWSNCRRTAKVANAY